MSSRVNDGRRTHWFWLDNVIIDKYAKDLKPMALAVYMYLCRRANENGVCWPSQRTMAEDLGIDRGTARTAVKRLVELGLITVEIRRNEDGSHNSTLYTLQDVACDAGGGSIAHRGSIARGGLNSPEENTVKKTQEKKVTPVGTPAAPDVSANDFVCFLAEELESAYAPLQQGRKARYGKEFKEQLAKGVPRPVLFKAADRIVERWVSDDHRKLTLEQALEDVVNGKPPRHAQKKLSLVKPEDQWKEGYHQHYEDYTTTTAEERRKIARQILSEA